VANFEKYRGNKFDDVKRDLESLGFVVTHIDNSKNTNDDFECLVVQVRLVDENHVEIITGNFKFLTSK